MVPIHLKDGPSGHLQLVVAKEEAAIKCHFSSSGNKSLSVGQGHHYPPLPYVPILLFPWQPERALPATTLWTHTCPHTAEDASLVWFPGGLRMKGDRSYRTISFLVPYPVTTDDLELMMLLPQTPHARISLYQPAIHQVYVALGRVRASQMPVSHSSHWAAFLAKYSPFHHKEN